MVISSVGGGGGAHGGTGVFRGALEPQFVIDPYVSVPGHPGRHRSQVGREREHSPHPTA